MELKLEEAEVTEALDYWLRQIHPTMMHRKEISKVVITQYPVSATVTIGAELPIPGNVPGTDDIEVPF